MRVEEVPNRSFLQWIIDRNPCYLLSGVLLLSGCLLITRGIDPHAEALSDLLLLVLLVNVYEVLVIGLGLWLARDPRLAKDAHFLLGVELLLLVDATTLYQTCIAQNFWAGVGVTAVAVPLALVKLGVITRALGLRQTPRVWACSLVSLAAVYAIPAMLRTGGGLPIANAWLTFAASGLVGVAIALHALPRQWLRHAPPRDAEEALLQRMVGLGMVVIPLVAAVLRVPTTAWVLDLPMHASFLALPLLGVGVWLAFSPALDLWSAEHRRRSSGALIATAVLCALWPAGSLWHVPIDSWWPSLAPLSVVAPLASGVMLSVWWQYRGVSAMAGPILYLTAVSLGQTLAQIVARLRQIVEFLVERVPTTAPGWGYVGVTLAFMLLLLGGALSLRARHETVVAESDSGTRVQ